MNRNWLRLTALSLAAAVALSLTACVAEPEEEETAPSDPVEAEPLTYHIYEQAEALAREIIPAVSDFPSAEDELPQGTVLDRVTLYSYDLNGQPQSKVVYYSPDEFDGDAVRDYKAVPADGRPEKKVIKAEDSDDVLREYSFIFDSEGRLIKEERTEYEDLSSRKPLKEPVKDTYGFSTDGLLVSWQRENGFEISYEYKDGELVKTTAESGKGIETIEIERDDSGRVIRTVVTKADGRTVIYSYGYDAGRIVSCDIKDGRNRKKLEISYTKSGWPETIKIFENGVKKKTERFTFEKKSEYLTVGKAKVSYDEADIFGGDSYRFSYPENLPDRGELNDSTSYKLAVLGTRIRYVRSSLRYEFENIPVRREISEADFTPLNSLNELYPVLNESYGKLLVPAPDGTEQLSKVVVSSNLGEVIGNVTTIVYDQKERPAGQICAFDLDALKELDIVEFDDSGRPVRTEDGGLVAQYSFADDMLSYTAVGDIAEYAYHSENEYLLSDRMPARILSLRDNEVFSNYNYHLEYTGEGLLTEYSYLDIFRHVFSYDYEDLSGRLSSVSWCEDDSTETQVFMSFDDHGYLTRYTRIMEHEIITITYSYIESE